MLKKIVLGTLLVAFIGVLVIGAINRTTAKASDNAGEKNGYRRGQSQLNSQQVVPSGGQWDGWGNTESLGNGSGTGQAVVGEWATVSGTVIAVDGNALVIKTADSAIVEVANRAWLYAQERGFVARLGDRVTVVGFYENGDLEVGRISNETSGQMVSLRDEAGRPLWAGRGRGNRR